MNPTFPIVWKKWEWEAVLGNSTVQRLRLYSMEQLYSVASFLCQYAKDRSRGLQKTKKNKLF